MYNKAEMWDFKFKNKIKSYILSTHYFRISTIICVLFLIVYYIEDYYIHMERLCIVELVFEYNDIFGKNHQTHVLCFFTVLFMARLT